MLEHFPAESAAATEARATAVVLDDFFSEADLTRPIAVIPIVPIVPVPVVGREAKSSAARPLSFLSAAALGVLFGTIIAVQFVHRPASRPVSPPPARAITELSPGVEADATARAAAESPVPASLPGDVESARVAIDAPKSPSQRGIDKAAVAAGPVAAPELVPPSPLVLQPLRDIPRPDPVIQTATLAPSPLSGATLPSTVEPPRSATLVVPEAPVNAVIPQAESSPASPVAAIDERSMIENVLSRYGSAYSDLDARAVKQVWPTATESALAKAFAGLEYQNLGFYECDTTIAGATARATCDGQVSYVGRVGPKQPRTENREWVFTLKKSDGLWQIERVQVR